MYLAAILVVIHLVFWLGITIIEAAESRAGTIPPRRPWTDAHPFPYFCDWNAATWGDLVGLSLIDWSVGLALSAMTPSALILILAVFAGFAGALIFHLRCMSARHKPDSGYPASGKVSAHGRAHLLYLFVQSTLCALMILLAATGELDGTTLALGLAGGAIYVTSFLYDGFAGRFSLLSKA